MADVQEEKMLIYSDPSNPKIIYREDVEDLWNVLRIRGIVSNIDVPDPIRTEGLEKWLFGLLEQLDYVRPLNIRKRGDIINGRGLQYVPQPEISEKIDMLV
jgi:hypothetical protein